VVARAKALRLEYDRMAEIRRELFPPPDPANEKEALRLKFGRRTLAEYQRRYGDPNKVTEA
jgi:hypothetical protein